MKILLFIVSTFFSLVSFAQKSIIIQGKIKNPLNDDIKLAVQDGLLSKPQVFVVPLNSKNEFKFVYRSDKMVRIDFTHAEATPNQQWYEAPKFYGWLFEPTDSIHIAFDTIDFWQTLHIEGKNEAKFQYYIEDFKVIDLQEKWRDQVENNEKLPVLQQFAYLDKVIDMKRNILNKFDTKFTTVFKQFQSAEITAMIGLIKIETLYKQRGMDKSFVISPLLGTFLFEELEQNNINAYSIDYLRYLDAVAELKFDTINKTEQKTNSQENYTAFRETFLKNQVKENILAQQTLLSLQFNPDKGASQKQYRHFVLLYPKSEFLEILSKEAKN